jgi:predicted ArsR family transcriptional regulator
MASLSSTPSRTPSDRLLFALKMRGPQSSAVLGRSLGISGEAARQQLLRLEDQGLVEARNEVRGVGRPVAVWHLTRAAARRFPDTHAQLTVDLLAIVREQLGPEALETVIATREQETDATYRAAMQGLETPVERIARLAEIRSDEGYMAEWTEDGDGYLLTENHCPICAAASQCQRFCRAELNVFRDVLGPEVEVERVEHIPQGARRCAYRIRPASGRSPD